MSGKRIRLQQIVIVLKNTSYPVLCQLRYTLLALINNILNVWRQVLLETDKNHLSNTMCSTGLLNKYAFEQILSFQIKIQQYHVIKNLTDNAIA